MKDEHSSSFTEESFRKWSTQFINANPEDRDSLQFLATWNGDRLWRWSKRAELMKDFVKMRKITKDIVIPGNVDISFVS